jgi:hypothetical protein
MRAEFDRRADPLTLPELGGDYATRSTTSATADRFQTEDFRTALQLAGRS